MMFLNRRDSVDNEKLWKATEDGDVDQVAKLLNNGANVNCPSNFAGQTLLHSATAQGNVALVELLLKAGASIYSKDLEGKTCVHYAASGGNKAIIEMILKMGASIEAKDYVGKTPLHDVSESGKADIVEVLVQLGASVDAETSCDETPLHFASTAEVVTQLLKAGADIEARANWGKTPMHYAAKAGREAVVLALLKFGADVDSKNSLTPLFDAIVNDHNAVVEILLEAGASMQVTSSDTAIDIALRYDKAEIAKTIESFQQKCSDNQDEPTTANDQLWQAAYDDNVNAAEIALSLGANTDYLRADTDNIEKSALHLAASNGNCVLINILLNAGASVDCKSDEGWTSLHFAAVKGQTSAAELLLKAGCVIDSKGNGGVYPLHLAAEYGHSNMVNLLLSNGASVNLRNFERQTALHLACNNSTVVDLLLKAGALKDLQDKDGNTALHLAAKYGFTKVVETLLKAGASCTIKDKNGKTPPEVEKKISYKSISAFASILQAQPPTNSTTSTNQPIDTHQPHDSKTSDVAADDAKKDKLNLTKRAEILSTINADYVGKIAEYLDLGGDPNSVNQDGDTLLHVAVRANREDILELLLESRNINANACNKDGVTPLTLAIKLRHRQIAKQIHTFTRPSISSFNVSDAAIKIDYNYSLGAGAFGCVFKGTVNDEEVAIKTAHRDNDAQEMLRQEILYMIKCRSPYIVEIVAKTMDPPKLALQYMDCGDLRKYLDAKRSGKPTAVKVTSLEVAWVVANALADLHHRSTLHRDLKSQNILMSTKHYIKLGDLGISREFSHNTMTKGAGTPYWEAPEVLRGDRYSYAADIYSYGVILTELDTLLSPYSDLQLNDSAIIDQVQRGLLKPSLSKNCEPWLQYLADLCLSFDPAQRPTAQTIVDFLQHQLSRPDRALIMQVSSGSQRSITSEATTANSSQSGFGSTTSGKPLCKWTQIPCQKCKSMNHITAETCVSCSSAMRTTADKVSLMLKRVIAAKRSSIDISTMMECQDCLEENDMNCQECAHCEVPLNDSEKLEELVYRFESSSLTTTN